MSQNIVSRGFGENSTIVTRGFGQTIADAIEEAADATVKALARGGAKAKKAAEEVYEDFVVKAALIAVNGVPIGSPAWSTVKKAYNESVETAIKVSDFAEVTVTKPSVKIIIDRIKILKD